MSVSFSFPFSSFSSLLSSYFLPSRARPATRDGRERLNFCDSTSSEEELNLGLYRAVQLRGYGEIRGLGESAALASVLGI